MADPFQRQVEVGLKEGDPSRVKTLNLEKYGKKMEITYETLTPEEMEAEATEAEQEVMEYLSNLTFAQRIGLTRQFTPGLKYYHGGIAGLKVGDDLVPSPPHKDDGCPICVARSAGRACTVGEYRAWLLPQLPGSERALAIIDGIPDGEVIDPPSAREAVYISLDLEYARFYASRSGHGDLYRVEPVGPMELSMEDAFETYIVPKARVVEVIARRVYRTRKERRDLDRRWAKADAALERVKREIRENA